MKGGGGGVGIGRDAGVNCRSKSVHGDWKWVMCVGLVLRALSYTVGTQTRLYLVNFAVTYGQALPCLTAILSTNSTSMKVEAATTTYRFARI